LNICAALRADSTSLWSADEQSVRANGRVALEALGSAKNNSASKTVVGRIKDHDRTIDAWISHVGNSNAEFYLLWGEEVKETSA
jgi:hypothetical protein